MLIASLVTFFNSRFLEGIYSSWFAAMEATIATKTSFSTVLNIKRVKF